VERDIQELARETREIPCSRNKSASASTISKLKTQLKLQNLGELAKKKRHNTTEERN